MLNRLRDLLVYIPGLKGAFEKTRTRDDILGDIEYDFNQSGPSQVKDHTALLLRRFGDDPQIVQPVCRLIENMEEKWPGWVLDLALAIHKEAREGHPLRQAADRFCRARAAGDIHDWDQIARKAADGSDLRSVAIREWEREVRALENKDRAARACIEMIERLHRDETEDAPAATPETIALRDKATELAFLYIENIQPDTSRAANCVRVIELLPLGSAAESSWVQAWEESIQEMKIDEDRWEASLEAAKTRRRSPHGDDLPLLAAALPVLEKLAASIRPSYWLDRNLPHLFKSVHDICGSRDQRRIVRAWIRQIDAFGDQIDECCKASLVAGPDTLMAKMALRKCFQIIDAMEEPQDRLEALRDAERHSRPAFSFNLDPLSPEGRQTAMFKDKADVLQRQIEAARPKPPERRPVSPGNFMRVDEPAP